MRKIMAALDVGNSLTKLVVADMTKKKFNVLTVSQVVTRGIVKNEIVSELLECISKVIKDCESKLKLPIKKLITIVPSFDIEFTIGEAKINIDNNDNIISGIDVTKVLDESAKDIVPANMELINNIPMYFKADNNQIVADPKKIQSNSLSVKSVLLMAPKKNIYKLLNVINKLGIEILDISINPIGDYYAFKNDKIDRQIGAIINIGSNKTNVSIINKGVITNTSVIELGGKNIDNDISYIYKISNNTAKKIKEEFAYATPKYALEDDEIIAKDKDGKEIFINQKELSKIVYSRLKEILEKAKLEIKNLTKKEISYIIITGGVSETTDFKYLIDEMFKNITIYTDMNYLGARNNKFSSVIGLIKWYNEIELLKERDYSIFTIDEQEELSGMSKEDLEADNSVLSKFFSYFLDN